MINKDIFNAMTIKLAAQDIPEKMPEMDPKIRRAPKRVVHLEKDEIELALKNALRYIPEEYHERLAPEFLNELKENTFKKHDCMTVAEAPGVPYEELEEFIGEDGYFSMIFDFRYADLDVASGSEWFKRVPWTIKDLNQKIMDSQMALQKCGWGANFIENHSS